MFKITPSGTLTTLSFCAVVNCGWAPYAGLVQAANGDVYGTTELGGANCQGGVPSGCGTVFQITTSGTLTTLYSFCLLSLCGDGDFPLAGLVQATNGDLYGTTYAGGAHDDGTVFRITPSGALSTIHSFCSLANCADGELPYAGLVQAMNDDLYGTTFLGGAGASCTFDNGCGTVFKITPSGTLMTLYSFCSLPNCADGERPRADLVQGTNGDLYGTMPEGGAYGRGTVSK